VKISGQGSGMIDPQMQDKVVLVTGANPGMGKP
jgi:hypothetical protein